MTVTDADRLAYDAPTLTLKDGRKLELHYGYGGLRRIEKHFGSLQGLTDAMGKGVGGEFYDAVFMGLLFGLWKTGITEAELEDQLDPAEIEKHGVLLSEALTLAFPKQAQAAVPSGENVTQNGSTGQETITSPPLSVVGQTETFG